MHFIRLHPLCMAADIRGAGIAGNILRALRRLESRGLIRRRLRPDNRAGWLAP